MRSPTGQPHPKHALPIGHTIAGYKIVRMVGQGGFGIVYEAVNPDTGERVAVKEFYPTAIATRYDGTIVVNSDRDADVYTCVLDRFRSTALLQYKFAHPNILKVRNYIRSSNTGYMITDYVEGQSLRSFLEAYGGSAPSEEMLQQIFMPIIQAIGYIHSFGGHGYLHRDISPENIMIDDGGKPVLIDFGALKRDLRASDTFSSVIFVREDFSPPEQLDRSPDRPEGFYTDIFALATTMYLALAGKTPLRVTSRLLQASGGDDPYVSIKEISKIACPPELYEAIDQSLRLPIRERPQSIADFVKGLGWENKTAPPLPDARDTQPAQAEAAIGPVGERDGGGISGAPDPGAAATTTQIVRPQGILPPSDRTVAVLSATGGREPETPVAEHPRTGRAWFGYAAVAAVILLVGAILWITAPSPDPSRAPVPTLPPPSASQTPVPSLPQSASRLALPSPPPPIQFGPNEFTPSDRTPGSTTSGFIFPDSDRRRLSREELTPRSLEELSYARNEIFARRGLIFGEASRFKSYFSRFQWYKPTIKKEKDIDLNDTEDYNSQLILSVEKEKEKDTDR